MEGRAKPRALVLTGYGINCDRETEFAFGLAGAEAVRVHVNDLISGKDDLSGYQILAFPGGFSFGDDIASGKVLANKVRTHLGERVARFIDDDKLVIGICNGFQVLAKYGLLPRLEPPRVEQSVTVTFNDSGRFEDRWVHLSVSSDRCVFLRGIERLDLPVAHGEGKVVADEATIRRLEEAGCSVLRYVDGSGRRAQGRYPLNPNGSTNDIAGICDSTGRVFGLMPHPERFLHFTNHPHWTRRRDTLRRVDRRPPEAGEGRGIFENAVAYFG
jgi:phosphoribosylformylglycinamidine synthase